MNQHHVIVTRPLPYAQALCQLLDEHEFHSLCHPLIEFVNNSDLSPEKIFHQLAASDTWIFISQQAVNYCLQSFDNQQLAQLKPKTIIAVGAATQLSLTKFGFISLIPQQSNSEGVLQLINHCNITQNSTITLVRGNQGRELLEQQLAQQFQLSPLEVYFRQTVTTNWQHLANISGQKAIIASSGQILEISHHLLNCAKLPHNNFAIISASARITDIAHNMGFNNCYTALSANNHDLLAACHQWRQANS
ncbi:MAG: uroporphyrinogen-III synthase [Kangiellaceae bacterium]|nr:uroporphyrinogen-III synthase [Kangiellaceae bacterium]